MCQALTQGTGREKLRMAWTIPLNLAGVGDTRGQGGKQRL